MSTILENNDKNTLTKIKPFAKIGFFTVAIILVVLLISIIFAIRSNNNQEDFPSNPTINPTTIPQPKGFQDEFSKIKSLIPYKTTNYSIEYLEPLNMINVKVKAVSYEDYLKSKSNAEEFIKSKGVKDICSLNIFWVPQVSNEVRLTFKPKATLTTGCSANPK